ncbi:MAG: hypothetical protein ABIO83_07140 [Ilumatobacteraceae bacterium]
MTLTKSVVSGTVSLLVLVGCATDGSTTDRAGNRPDPVTLTLATNERADDTGGQIVQRFVEQVDALSDGQIIIEPVYGLPLEAVAAWDQAVIHSVQRGEYDLVLARAGAWHDLGVTSLDVLQLPGVADTDEQADHIAQSAVATELLAGLDDAKMIGLGLFPDGLRHLVSLDGAELSFDGLKGRSVRTPGSATVFAILESLGALPVDQSGPDFNLAVLNGDVGLTDTTVTRLDRQPIPEPRQAPVMAANFTLYTKFDVLAARSDVIDALGDDAEILRSAASQALTETVAGRPRETDGLTAACDSGLFISSMSSTDHERMIAAVQPVIDKIENGNDSALVAEVRKAAGPASATPMPTCPPKPVPANSGQEIPASRADVVPRAGELPNGSYRVQLDPAILDEIDGCCHGPESREFVELHLHDGTFEVEVRSPAGVLEVTNTGGIYQVDGSSMVMAQGPEGIVPGTNGIQLFTWTLVGDTLTLEQMDDSKRDVYYALPFTRVSSSG